MRIGIFSDIHGNCVALDAACEDMDRHGVDSRVCLGDALQGGCQPAEVAERLKALNCPVIMGNADSWLLTGRVEAESSEKVSDRMQEVGDWSRAQLGDEGISYIESFLPTHDVALEGGKSLLAFHGSPASFDEVILPDMPAEEIQQAVGDVQANVLAGGHVHLQWVGEVGDSLFLNPGSVGVSYNRMLPREAFYVYPIAEYAILTSDKESLTLEFCRVPFSVELLGEAALTSGRPYADGEAAQYRPR